MNGKPTIRLGTEHDVPAMFRVRTSVRENHLSMLELAAMGITPEALRGAIQAEPCAWVAIEAGEVLGFAMVDLQEACLFAAFVLPEQERRGIGRALIAACEAALFARHDMIWLETAGTSRAAGLYQRLGWRVTQDLGDGDLRLEKCRA